MNALWAGMMLMAIIYGTFHGTIPAVTQAALDSAKEAVSLCITMLGNPVVLDGTDADRDGIRPGGTVDERCGTIAPETVSTDSGRSSCHGADRSELHCQYAGTWLGCHSGGNEGNGGIVETGEDSQRTGGGSPGRDCQ